MDKWEQKLAARELRQLADKVESGYFHEYRSICNYGTQQVESPSKWANYKHTGELDISITIHRDANLPKDCTDEELRIPVQREIA